jgi:hypothetical protein
MRRRDKAGHKAVKAGRQKALKRRNAPKATDRSGAAADLEDPLERRTRELNEAREQQAATLEVLKVISSSRIHIIASEMLTELGASSKLNAEWEFFSMLRDEGRRSAQVFLETHASDLGRRSTLDLDVLLESI